LFDEVDVLDESDVSISVGIDDLEDLSEQLIIGSELEEVSVFCEKGDELLKTEPKSLSVLLVLSLDDDLDEEDFQNDGHKLFECSKLILFSLKLEVRVNDITDFVFIKMENVL
jgi:hypothetical protein